MKDDGKLARLYADGLNLSGSDTLELSAEHAHYLSKVMRKSVGDKIRLFNETNGEWVCEIMEISRKSMSVTPIEQLRTPSPSLDIELCLGILKKPRLGNLLEKATELGVAKLRPVITDRVQFPKLAVDKHRKYLIEAAEQTERMDIPVLAEPLKLDALLSDWPDNRFLVFADEAASAAPALQAIANIDGPISFLVGPEGGFTDEERALITAHPNTVPVTLGPRILRAETAAFALLSLWQSVHGDWTQAPRLTK